MGRRSVIFFSFSTHASVITYNIYTQTSQLLHYAFLQIQPMLQDKKTNKKLMPVNVSSCHLKVQPLLLKTGLTKQSHESQPIPKITKPHGYRAHFHTLSPSKAACIKNSPGFYRLPLLRSRVGYNVFLEVCPFARVDRG